MKRIQRYQADGMGLQLPKAEAADAKWCALFPKGNWHHWSGEDFDFNETLVAEFIASWKAAGSPPLPITIHHVEGDLASYEKASAAQAAGWIEDLRPGSGDIALEGAVKWTDDAKGLIAADKYRYLSPEWSMNHVDRRSGDVGGPWLYGAALLNDPFFNSMPRVAASTKPTQPTTAAPKAKEQKMIKRICAALRLSETASEDEVVAAVEKLSATVTESEVKLTAAAKQNAAADAMKATLDVLKASNEALEKRVAASEVEKKEAALTALIDGARNSGVAMPEPLVATIKVLASHDFESAKKLVASLPKNPALAAELGASGKGNEGEETPATATAKLNAAIDELAAKGVNRFEARMQVLATHSKLAAIVAADTKNLTSRKDA